MITNSIHNQLISIKEKKGNTQIQVSKAESYLDHQTSMLSYPLVVHEEYITDNYGYWYRIVENRCFSKRLYLVRPWKVSLLQGRHSSLKTRVDWPARNYLHYSQWSTFIDLAFLKFKIYPPILLVYILKVFFCLFVFPHKNSFQPAHVVKVVGFELSFWF